MEQLKITSFYPNNYICCPADLPFDDGTYEFIERQALLNLIIIKNHRIQYHIVYNMERKQRLITWKFEYLEKDGKNVENIWRQTMNTNKYDLYSSSHWEYYPEEHIARKEFQTNVDQMWNNISNHIENCRENNIDPFC
jgi:hypothetical protein